MENKETFPAFSRRLHDLSRKAVTAGWKIKVGQGPGKAGVHGRGCGIGKFDVEVN